MMQVIFLNFAKFAYKRLIKIMSRGEEPYSGQFHKS